MVFTALLQVPQPRNWERLSQKLITPGSSITVVAYGGSVTVGHHQYNEDSSWPEEFVRWMTKAFPGVTVNLINLGHGATVAMAAALCYYHDMPAGVDLVLVEYSINGCGAGQCLDFSHPQVSLQQPDHPGVSAVLEVLHACALQLQEQQRQSLMSLASWRHHLVICVMQRLCCLR